MEEALEVIAGGVIANGLVGVPPALDTLGNYADRYGCTRARS